MGFIDTYLDKYRLDKMPQSVQEDLNNLEKEIEKKLPEKVAFEDVLKQYAPAISDLIARASAGMQDIKFSFASFRWVINIGIEVYQIVDQMETSVVTAEMNSEQRRVAKVDLGKDLVCFVWITIDPLKNYLNWLPFKKTIERGLVRWLAGYALNAAVDFLAANDGLRPFAAPGNIVVTFKAIP